MVALIIFVACMSFSIISAISKSDHSGTILSLITGYVSGYIVYLLTLLIPTCYKNKKMRKVLIEGKLLPVYRKAVYLLLLMCKNCSTTERWETIAAKKTDFDCLNSGDFYKSMCLFDITSPAESMLQDKESGEKIKWHDTLERYCEWMSKELDESVSNYQIYLTEEMIKCIIDIKQTVFIQIFTGHIITFVPEFTDKEGYKYIEEYPIGRIYAIQDNLQPIFCGDANQQSLKEYVSALGNLRMLIQTFAKNKKAILDDYAIQDDYAIKKLRDKKMGHCGSAIWVRKTHKTPHTH